MKVYFRRNPTNTRGTLCNPMDTERNRESGDREGNQPVHTCRHQTARTGEDEYGYLDVVVSLQGTECNPFSLDALAVFMYRVLQRVNHPNREEFENELYDRFGSLVKMPLLKSDRKPLPDPVKDILEEGISLYRRHTLKHKRLEPNKGIFAKDWSQWEKRLRNILFGNADYFNSVQVPFGVAVKEVLEQLKNLGKSESQTPDTEKRKFGNIIYAAITLPVEDIGSLLDRTQQLATKDPKVKDFLKGKSLKSNLEKAHVTLAHKRSHGVPAVASYGPFVQQKVDVELTALLLSNNVAALEAQIGSVNGEKLSPKNEWPHVTVWTAAGTAAKEANLLPHLLSEGKATRIVIDPPITVTGVVDFY